MRSSRPRGAETYKNWIAHEWKFTEFSGRDQIFLALVILGGLAFAYGLIEQSFLRRSALNPTGIAVFAAGLIGSAVGFIGLHTTDGVSKNVIFSAIGAAGVVATVVGLALARWQRRSTPAADTSSLGSMSEGVKTRVGLGLAGVAVACLIHVPFDRKQRLPILTWSSSGLRPVIAIIGALIGIALAVRALLPGLRGKWKASSLVKVLAFCGYSGLLVMTLVISVLQLATVQALRATTMVVLGGGGLSLLMIARGQVARSSRRLQLLIGLVTAAALVILALVVRSDSGAVRFRTGLLGAMLIGATLIVANSLLEYFMQKRTVGDFHADRLGRRLQVTGAAMAFVGLAMRLVWSNLTPEHAKQVKAAGGAVGVNVLRQTVVWWILVAVIGAIVLTKTRWGNWIFAVGGNRDAARAIGVPANQVKVGLFVAVSLCGALSGTLIALRYGTVQANVGTGAEFEYIIAAVVGGCLMTGGYGSVIGSSLGAAILAISAIGMQTVPDWNSDGRYAFLGGVLLAAVLVNNYTRKKAQEAR